MRATLWKLVLFTSFFLLGQATSTDICGQITGNLQLPSSKPPYKPTSYGHINECICHSQISSYVGSNVAAVAGSGRGAVTAAITGMFDSCEKHTCQYPPHAVPQCMPAFPCGFTCSDGFQPYPYGRPTDCVCNKPYTVCNGQCGLFKGCPSGRPTYKRELSGSDKCYAGFTECPIPGRGGESTECVDTETDLESCGGCIHSGLPGRFASGVDCSSIEGVADVSCMRGQCVVHRCMPGYSHTKFRDSCFNAEGGSEIVLGSFN